MFLLKIVASLIGAVLALGGVIAFLVGLWLDVCYLLFKPSSLRMAGAAVQSRPNLGTAVFCTVGGIVALYLGTQLGRFARGDFD